MGMAFCFWWWYFDGAAGASERHIRSRRQATLSQIWSYAHWPLYIGIALSAVGVKHVVALAPGDHLHPMEAWILCGSVALTMTSVTIIGMTSEASQRCPCLLMQTLPHGCLAMSALLTGFVGHLVPPVLLVTALTMLSALQVGFSVRGRRSNSDLVQHHDDELPTIGSHAAEEHNGTLDSKMSSRTSIHLFWPGAFEEGKGANATQPSYF
jgi:low temperature requirement protein LtrA